MVPIILITVSITGFFMFTNPLYQEINTLRSQAASYNEALGNSKALENERDKLTTKYNAIDPDALVKIQKLLPDNVDNIRLILEIEKVAMPYGMALRDVKYDTTSNSTTTPSTTGAIQASPTGSQTSSKDYGTWSLSFSTQGTYSNFLNFLQDLEKNLRIVDVSSIQFSSDTGQVVTNPALTEAYKFSFVINTYWLKN